MCSITLSDRSIYFVSHESVSTDLIHLAIGKNDHTLVRCEAGNDGARLANARIRGCLHHRGRRAAPLIANTSIIPKTKPRILHISHPSAPHARCTALPPTQFGAVRLASPSSPRSIVSLESSKDLK